MPPENGLLEKLDSISIRLDSLETRLSKIESIQASTVSIPAPPKPSPVFQVQSPIEETREEESLEMRLGSQWFSRLGITALVIGFSLFLINSLQYFSPFQKIMVGYLVSVCLVVLGHYLDTHLKKFGQVLIGGGVSLLYFTTYAMHFFDSVKIINNQALVLFMLSLIGACYLYYALKRNLETMIYIALGLVFLSANLGNIQYFSLVSLIIFTAISAIIASVSSYRGILLFSLIASYLTIMRWFFGALLDESGVIFIVIFSFVNYLVFASAANYLFKDDKKEDSVNAATLVLLNSISFFGITSSALSARFSGSAQEMAVLAFCVLNLGISGIYQYVSKISNLFKPYFGLGVGFLFFYLPMVLDNSYLPLGWGLLALAFIIYGGLYGTIRTRSLGIAILTISFFAVFDLFSMSNFHESLALIYLFVFAFITEIISRFYANYQLNRQEGDNVDSDNQIISAYSAFSVFATVIFIYKLVDPSVLTLSWGLAGFVIPLVGFLINDKTYRRAGLGLLLMVVAKLFLIDFADLDGEIKVLSFIFLGIVLLVISYGYNRYKEEIKRYL